MFRHILLEVYCGKEDVPEGDGFCCCVSDDHRPGYGCLDNGCPYVTFTSHENALCYVDGRSEAAHIISLGGDMLPDHMDGRAAEQLWQQISEAKIQEAYTLYMQEINTLGRRDPT